MLTHNLPPSEQNYDVLALRAERGYSEVRLAEREKKL